MREKQNTANLRMYYYKKGHHIRRLTLFIAAIFIFLAETQKRHFQPRVFCWRAGLQPRASVHVALRWCLMPLMTTLTPRTFVWAGVRRTQAHGWNAQRRTRRHLRGLEHRRAPGKKVMRFSPHLHSSWRNKLLNENLKSAFCSPIYLHLHFGQTLCMVLGNKVV